MPLDYCFHSQAALNIVKEEVAKNIREETKEQWEARLLKAYELPKKIIDKATAQMSLRVRISTERMGSIRDGITAGTPRRGDTSYGTFFPLDFAGR